MDNKSEVVFVTDLEVSGIMNGVVNMAFSTAQFVPQIAQKAGEDPRPVVATAPVITANLRFDLRVAQIVRDRLDELIEENTKPRKADA